MTLRLPTLFASLRARRRAAFWGAGAATVRTTPWHVDTLRPAGRAEGACGRGLVDAA